MSGLQWAYWCTTLSMYYIVSICVSNLLYISHIDTSTNAQVKTSCQPAGGLGGPMYWIALKRINNTQVCSYLLLVRQTTPLCSILISPSNWYMSCGVLHRICSPFHDVAWEIMFKFLICIYLHFYLHCMHLMHFKLKSYNFSYIQLYIFVDTLMMDIFVEFASTASLHEDSWL